MSVPAGPAVVEGVDVDALAAAVRACDSVAGVTSGLLGGVATYLPRRRVEGVSVERDRVTIELCSVWGVALDVVAQQVRAAVHPLVGARQVDIVVSDIADSPDDASPSTPAPP
ncbi:MAG: Asp23/Gls24 family envelope stress response protein [Gordonia polyisoprenivorans]|nr:Asp23/Gls24 family envelope stress response protein [Gordonia polyisoprenivorans]